MAATYTGKRPAEIAPDAAAAAKRRCDDPCAASVLTGSLGMMMHVPHAMIVNKA